MWGIGAVYDAWRSRKPRAVAIGALSPFFDRARASRTQDWEKLWSQPYLMGFAASAISRLALFADATLSSESLAIVQVEAWAELTGLPGSLFGELVTTMSLDGDADFAQGCADALGFVAALGGSIFESALQRTTHSRESELTQPRWTERGPAENLWDTAIRARLI